MEGKRGFCGFAAFTELTPQRPCAMDSEAGRDGGGVVSFFRGSAFTCLCVTERDGNQDLPSACPPGQFREASCPWGKGLGCEQWAESPAVSEGALCHPAPVGPPWGNLEPGVNGGRL